MIDTKIARAYTRIHGNDYVLRLLAEECGELTQAALKYIRMLFDGEMQIDENKAYEDLCEETADVLNVIALLIGYMDGDVTSAFEKRVAEIRKEKQERMLKRVGQAALEIGLCSCGKDCVCKE